jgi:hypothetical protein
MPSTASRASQQTGTFDDRALRRAANDDSYGKLAGRMLDDQRHLASFRHKRNFGGG